jgi:hypothetical protein
MPISRIKRNAINDSAINLAKTDNLFVNTEITGTEAARMPQGTTAQRASAQTGDIRFNSTISLMEYYDGTIWKSIDSPPVVSSINPASIADTDSSVDIVITGSNFQSGATVKAVGTDGSEINATTVTVNSSTQVTANFDGTSFSDANEDYDIVLTNSSGLSGTLADSLAVNASPVWTTAASPTTLATVNDGDTISGSTVQVVATDDEGASLTYSLGSGSLPAGLSVQTDGTITGTVTAGSGTYASGGETYTPTLSVTDGTNSVNRTFAIVKKWYDGSTAALAAESASDIKTLTGVGGSGLYWLKPSSWTYPAQFFCEMGLNGGGWIYVMQRQCVNDNGLPGSWLSGTSGTPNGHSSNFYGVTDSNGGTHSVQDIWNGFIGSGNNGKPYFREIQTSGGSYDESQRYTGSTDNAIFSWTDYSKMFYGNFADGTSATRGTVKVWYDNGSNSATGKYLETWSGGGGLVTINNGNVDQNLYFCNGEDGGDGNWMFGLMKGGTPYPGSANASNGGARGSITRWGVAAIKA